MHHGKCERCREVDAHLGSYGTPHHPGVAAEVGEHRKATGAIDRIGKLLQRQHRCRRHEKGDAVENPDVADGRQRGGVVDARRSSHTHAECQPGNHHARGYGDEDACAGHGVRTRRDAALNLADDEEAQAREIAGGLAPGAGWPGGGGPTKQNGGGEHGKDAQRQYPDDEEDGLQDARPPHDGQRDEGEGELHGRWQTSDALGTIGSRVRAQQLNERSPAHVANAEERRQDHDREKAARGPAKGIGRECEDELVRDVEDEGGDKAGERRYHDRSQHADDQGEKAHDTTLVSKDARDGRCGHAQNLVEREFAGAATQDEAVRVDDEEREHDDGEHRERLHDAVGGVVYAPLLLAQVQSKEIVCRCRERVQEARGEGQGHEVDRVIPDRAPDVPDGNLCVHGRTPSS